MNKKGKAFILILTLLIALCMPALVFAAEEWHDTHTGDTFGDWTFYEAVEGGNTSGVNRESWSNWAWGGSHPDGNLCWKIENHSQSRKFTDWKWTYNATYAQVNQPYFAVSLLNDSSMNRSEILTNVKINVTAGSAYCGQVFGCENKSNLDVVLYGSNTCYILHWNGTQLTDKENGTNCTFAPAHARDWWGATDTWDETQEAWMYETDMATENGTWIRSLFNPLHANGGYFNTHAWGGIVPVDGYFFEPSKWIFNMSLSTTYNGSKSMGIAIWNPDKINFTAWFDHVSVWRHNYSKNLTDTSAYPWGGTGQPLKEFPVVNMDTYVTTFLDFVNSSVGDNMSSSAVVNLMRNVTNSTAFDSWYHTQYHATDLQDYNTTTCFYSAVLTNCSKYYEYLNADYPYNNWLFVWVDTVGDGSVSDSDNIFFGFDFEQDGAWDDNDVAYYWTVGGTEWAWHATEGAMATNAITDAWETSRVAVQNIHRGMSHVMYLGLIPLGEMMKANGETITLDDRFDMVEFTHNTGELNLDVWSLYNETACSELLDHNRTWLKPYLINEILLEVDALPDINSTVLWGEGHITGDFINGSTLYSMEVLKSCNVTEITSGYDRNHRLNYTIQVHNTGTAPITHVYVNDTWWNCSCSDWNATLIYTNIAPADRVWDTLGCTVTFGDSDVWPIAAGDYWNITLVIDLSSCSNRTSHFELTNIATGNASYGLTEIGTQVVDWAPVTYVRPRNDPAFSGQERLLWVLLSTVLILAVLWYIVTAALAGKIDVKEMLGLLIAVVIIVIAIGFI